jgi:hypothetical protein
VILAGEHLGGVAVATGTGVGSQDGTPDQTAVRLLESLGERAEALAREALSRQPPGGVILAPTANC